MLAGLRLGYMIANPEITETTKKISGLYPINALTHVAGVAALDDLARTQRYSSEVKQATLYAVKELQKIGLEAMPTQASLVLFKHPSIPPQKVQKMLEKQNVFVRYPFFKELPDWLRMNVGTVASTRKLLAIFEKVFK